MEQDQYSPYQGPNGRPPKKPMHPGVVVAAIICGCVMFLGFWAIFFGQLFGNMFSALGGTHTYEEQALYDSTIDVIKVEGTIAEGGTEYQHQWTLDTIDALMESDKNKGILLYVNSPGGGVYEADELYLKLKEYKEKTKRPVYAYMGQTAASGGYYICMAADKVYANRMTMTGSIGVIMSMMDTTGLQELIGVKEENIVSGKNKAMGNPLTEEQRQILQSMVDETYNVFVDIVAEGRNLDRNKVLKLADGRVYSAQQAKEQGLIDEVAGYEDTVKAMKELDGLGDCEVFEQQAPSSLMDELFYGVESQIPSSSAAANLDKITSYIEANKSPRLMYYMQ